MFAREAGQVSGALRARSGQIGAVLGLQKSDQRHHAVLRSLGSRLRSIGADGWVAWTGQHLVITLTVSRLERGHSVTVVATLLPTERGLGDWLLCSILGRCRRRRVAVVGSPAAVRRRSDEHQLLALQRRLERGKASRLCLRSSEVGLFGYGKSVIVLNAEAVHRAFDLLVPQ